MAAVSVKRSIKFMKNASPGNLECVKELMCIPTVHQLRGVKIRKKYFY